MSSHHHHHQHHRDEQQQIDSDEALAARLQAEENQSYSNHYPSSDSARASGYPGQGQHGGPPRPQGDGYYAGDYPQSGPRYQYQGGPSPEYQTQNQGQAQFQSLEASQQNPYPGGPPAQPLHPYRISPRPLRRKSLLIGINYVGSQHTLRGCHQDVTNMTDFLNFKGYSSDRQSQVIMRDDRNTDPRGPFFPTGRNILAAMQWLVSEPNTCNFLHYSGHGSQVKDPDGDRDSGFDDTIVPVDFESNGQIDSDKLHRTLVSALPANSTLFVIFDCCHSGSAIELPYVYRSDADGNVSMLDNVKTGMGLLHEASSLIQGGFTMDKLPQAKELLAGAATFFKQLQHSGEPEEEGVGEEHFVEDWKSEHKFVTMFSGCRDDQTSADASIGGASVGAMSWAFLEAMKRTPDPSYLITLQQTRSILGQSNYKQVPQLSIGFKELDLDQPLRF
ncbi:hypothetical protein H2200_001559 [Cladophialophora chaetospira]|uniref:Peptidase C14 caspase domain-containing protein n=1 Tax=Cladophialophora chaetospira TaxID=386627 RepID=A0AA38XL50_9EURO|nr:hypothetical protein H2200_001559 [Cladophialophora chaetospira]